MCALLEDLLGAFSAAEYSSFLTDFCLKILAAGVFRDLPDPRYYQGRCYPPTFLAKRHIRLRVPAESFFFFSPTRETFFGRLLPGEVILQIAPAPASSIPW
jgi:hypothetical protein